MRILLIFIAFLLNISCVSSRKFSHFISKGTPPNCLEISENFFCDITEVSNQGYREFLYWTQNVYGKNSTQANFVLPDATVWSKNIVSFYDSEIINEYFSFPAYNNYPVVGISQEQAKLYSKWRSDRVFEMLLIKYGIIESDSKMTPESHFTIERFFNGEIKKIKEDIPVLFYPQYRLPTINESKILINYYDSINQSFFQNYPFNCMKFYQDTSLNSSEYKTSLVYTDCLPKRPKNILFNIRGNVSEWNEEPSLISGASWSDEKYRTNVTDTTSELSSSWIGFRNVFEWKEYSKSILP